MRLGYCFFFLLLTIQALYAQPIKPDPGVVTPEKMNQFRQALAVEKTDTGRLRLLIRMGRGYLQLGYPDSQLVIAQKALTLAQRLKRPGEESVASFLMIWSYRHIGRYPQALEVAFSNLKRAEESGDSIIVLEALRHVMFTYNDMQEYHLVLPYGRRAQRIVHSGIFNNQDDFLHNLLSGYTGHMGRAFEGLRLYDSALQYKQKAYAVASLLNDHQDLAVTSGSLGNFYFIRSMYDSALFYLKKCLFHTEQANFRADLAARAQVNMAKIYRVRNEFNTALYYAALALKTAQQKKELEITGEASSLLHSLYADKGVTDSAYKYLLLATTAKDSLFNKETIRQVEGIKYKDALQRQQQEQESQKAKEQYQAKLLMFGIAGSILLLSLVAFSYYRFRQVKHENNLKSGFSKKIQQLEIRALRAQMNPHFIFNCLNSINRYIVKSDHATASDYLGKFARLIRFILDNSASDTIPLDKEIQTLQLYLDMEVLRFDHAFRYAIEVEEGLLPENLLIPPMLIQPYVENAIWHGLLQKETNDGKVWVRFRRRDETVIFAEVEDNGIGRQKARELKSKDALLKKSYGMKLTSDRIFLLNELYGTRANVVIEDLTDSMNTPGGTRVILTIPVKEAAVAETSF